MKSQNPIRVGVELVVRELYRFESDIDERGLKKKLKGDEVVLETVEGEKVKFDLFEN